MGSEVTGSTMASTTGLEAHGSPSGSDRSGGHMGIPMPIRILITDITGGRRSTWDQDSIGIMVTGFTLRDAITIITTGN